MKKILILLVILTGCAPKVEFYYNGNPCYTIERCVSRHEVTKCDYHYGWNYITNTYEYHYGNYTEEVCDKIKIDTLIIKKK